MSMVPSDNLPPPEFWAIRLPTEEGEAPRYVACQFGEFVTTEDMYYAARWTSMESAVLALSALHEKASRIQPNGQRYDSLGLSDCGVEIVWCEASVNRHKPVSVENSR